jgi:hypothetical protein
MDDPRDEIISRLKQAVEALLKYVPEGKESQARKSFAEYTLSDAFVQDATERFASLKESAKRVKYRSLLQSTATKVYNVVQGGLTSAINAHGPITNNLVPSATKRISRQLAASMIIKVSDSGEQT